MAKKKSGGYAKLKRIARLKEIIKGSISAAAAGGAGLATVASAATLDPVGVAVFGSAAAANAAYAAGSFAEKRRQEDLLSTFNRMKASRQFREKQAAIRQKMNAVKNPSTQRTIKDAKGTGEVKAHVRTSSKGRKYLVRGHTRKRTTM